MFPKIDIDLLKNYIMLLFDDKRGGFLYFKKGNLTLLSSTFGIQLKFLLNDSLIYLKTRTTKYFCNQQDEQSGLFIDNNFNFTNVIGFEKEYILWQFTYFTTLALDMLGQKPRYNFKFLKNFKHKKFLEHWLNNQNFSNFWLTSNKIMFLFYFLTYEQERLGIDNKSIINYFFDLLDNKQDVNTGFWGTNEGASLENGMYGASHVYLFYDFHKRKINNYEKAIDNVIHLQNKYGLFGSKLGGSCEDYDAVEALCILTKNSSYRRKQIIETLSKVYKEITKHQNKDGGFPYFLDNRNIFQKYTDMIFSNNYQYLYSGWNRMQSEGFKSDLWATYFRILTLAKIEKKTRLKKIYNYKFYSLPGWGYY